MEVKTVDTLYTLSEQIALHLAEVVNAISMMPPKLQNAYAVRSAAILLGFDDEWLSASPALQPSPMTIASGKLGRPEHVKT